MAPGSRLAPPVARRTAVAQCCGRTPNGLAHPCVSRGTDTPLRSPEPHPPPPTPPPPSTTPETRCTAWHPENRLKGGGGSPGYGRPVDRGAWTAKAVKRPRQQPAHPQYANYWALLTRKRHTMPHSAQPEHTNHWAPRTRKRHQQEHRPQRPTESSDPTQHAKGRTGDRPGPRKGATTRRNVTQGVPPSPLPTALTLPQRHSHTPTPAPNRISNRQKPRPPPIAFTPPVTALQRLWDCPNGPPLLQAKPLWHPISLCGHPTKTTTTTDSSSQGRWPEFGRHGH